MKLSTRLHRIPPSIPTASMADIAFLLIIFFMLTTSFSPERTSVQLPESQIRTDVAEKTAIVAVTEEGAISFTSGDEAASPLSGPEELGLLTREIVQVIPDKQFVIKADRSARYEMIDRVLEELRNNGAKNIGLLTRQEAQPQS